MPPNDCIQHDLYWATHRCVPEKFRDSHLSAGIHSLVWLLTRGSVVVEPFGEKPVRYDAGQWIMHKALSGTQQFSEDAKLISIRFDILHPHGLPLFERPETIVVEAAQAQRLTQQAETMISILDTYRNGRDRYVPRREIPPLDFFRIESAFCAWITEYIGLMLAHGQRMTSGVINDPRVRDGIDYLNRHDTRKKLVETEIAQLCGLSVNRLNTLFRQEIGRTVGEYYAQRRFRLARVALLDPSRQVKEIAFELGFRNSAHFSNWFSGRQKCSPREFRQSLPKEQGGGR